MDFLKKKNLKKFIYADINECEKVKLKEFFILADAMIKTTHLDKDILPRFGRSSDIFIKNEDFESIKREIYKKHALRLCDYDGFHLNLILSKLHEKRRIDCPKNGNTTVVYESHSYVENHNSVPLELNTILFTKNFTGTNVVRINKTAGFKVNVNNNEITIPFASFKVSVDEDFGENNTIVKHLEKSTIVELSPQTLEVDPFSKVKITHLVYEYVNINEFLLDFEVDDSSAIWCSSMFRENEIDSPKSYLREFHTTRQYGNKGQVLDGTQGNFIVRNFPATETIVSFGIRVKFGAAEKI